MSSFLLKKKLFVTSQHGPVEELAKPPIGSRLT